MTELNEEALSEKAYQLNDKVVANERERRRLFFENISLLEEILQGHLYKYIVDEDASWASYLGELDVFYTRSEVVRWLRIKGRLVNDFGFKIDELLSVPATKLEAIVGVAKDAADAKVLLEMAGVAKGKDWRNEIKLRQGKHLPDDGHPHDFVDFKQCKVCGEKHKLEDEKK